MQFNNDLFSQPSVTRQNPPWMQLRDALSGKPQQQVPSTDFRQLLADRKNGISQSSRFQQHDGSLPAVMKLLDEKFTDDPFFKSNRESIAKFLWISQVLRNAPSSHITGHEKIGIVGVWANFIVPETAIRDAELAVANENVSALDKKHQAFADRVVQEKVAQKFIDKFQQIVDSLYFSVFDWKGAWRSAMKSDPESKSNLMMRSKNGGSVALSAATFRLAEKLGFDTSDFYPFKDIWDKPLAGEIDRFASTKLFGLLMKLEDPRAAMYTQEELFERAGIGNEPPTGFSKYFNRTPLGAVLKLFGVTDGETIEKALIKQIIRSDPSIANDDDLGLFLRSVSQIMNNPSAIVRAAAGDERTYSELSDKEQILTSALDMVPGLALGIASGGSGSAVGLWAKLAQVGMNAAKAVAVSLVTDVPDIALLARQKGSLSEALTETAQSVIAQLDPRIYTSDASPAEKFQAGMTQVMTAVGLLAGGLNLAAKISNKIDAKKVAQYKADGGVGRLTSGFKEDYILLRDMVAQLMNEVNGGSIPPKATQWVNPMFDDWALFKAREAQRFAEAGNSKKASAFIETAFAEISAASISKPQKKIRNASARIADIKKDRLKTQRLLYKNLVRLEELKKTAAKNPPANRRLQVGKANFDPQLLERLAREVIERALRNGKEVDPLIKEILIEENVNASDAGALRSKVNILAQSGSEMLDSISLEESLRHMEETRKKHPDLFPEGGNDAVKRALIEDPEYVEIKYENETLAETDKLPPETRVTIRTDAYNAIMDGANPKQEHVMIITIGLPGSGKSSMVSAELMHARNIDIDATRKHIPENNNGRHAQISHAEAAGITDRVLAESLKRGDNVVIQKVGASIKQIQHYLNRAESHGYEVHLIYSDLNNLESSRRASIRRREGGRYVNLEWILDLGDAPKVTFDTLKHDSRIVSYKAYNNNVPFGQKPILYESVDRRLAQDKTRRTKNNKDGK